MRLKTLALAAASITALAIPASAQLAGGPDAGMVLHQNTNAGGAAYPTETALPNLSSIRFNDQVSSVTVYSGLWELCTDGNYNGRCEIVDSSVSDLRAIGLNNNISSVRPVTERPVRPRPGRPDPVATPNVDESAAIVFYDRTRLRGQALPLNASTDNFSRLRFNDRAESVRVNAGVWRICTDGGFRGKCDYVDASVNNLNEIGLSGNISSAELTPYSEGPGRFQISLFNRDDFRGEFLGFNEGVRDLSSYNYNDTAGSILIKRGTWLVCEDANFRGRCEVLDASILDLDEVALDNTITSFRKFRPREDEHYRRRDDGYGADRGLGGGYGTGNGGYRDDDGYDRPRRRGLQGGGIEGEQTVFFPRPTYNGERIRNGDGQATRFCREQGFNEALYKAPGRVLSDVLCR